MLQQYSAAEPDVRLFNPSMQEHGWCSPHTVLQVHQTDMPFLVASIRCELNRRNIAIHTIKSVPLQVHRDSAHKLKQLSFSSSMKIGRASCSEGRERTACVSRAR